MSKKVRALRLNDWLLFLFKLLSAIMVGLMISLIGQALLKYSYFSFMFIFLTGFLAFFPMVKKLEFPGVLCVDMLFIFIILLVKVYIVFADKG